MSWSKPLLGSLGFPHSNNVLQVGCSREKPPSARSTILKPVLVAAIKTPSDVAVVKVFVGKLHLFLVWPKLQRIFRI
jgi:hypothetical protein